MTKHSTPDQAAPANQKNMGVNDICQAEQWTLTLVSERVQVQVFPAFEGLSTFRARERMAGVEQSV